MTCGFDWRFSISAALLDSPEPSIPGLAFLHQATRLSRQVSSEPNKSAVLNRHDPERRPAVETAECRAAKLSVPQSCSRTCSARDEMQGLGAADACSRAWNHGLTLFGHLLALGLGSCRRPPSLSKHGTWPKHNKWVELAPRSTTHCVLAVPASHPTLSGMYVLIESPPVDQGRLPTIKTAVTGITVS
jgi:hypothetical protein